MMNSEWHRRQWRQCRQWWWSPMKTWIELDRNRSFYSPTLLNLFVMSFHVSYSFSMPTNAPNGIKCFVCKESRHRELVLCIHLHSPSFEPKNENMPFLLLNKLHYFLYSGSFSFSLYNSAVRSMFFIYSIR